MPSESYAKRKARIEAMTDEQRSARDFRRAMAHQNRLESMSPAERLAAKEAARARQREYRKTMWGTREVPQGG